jgi:tetratricopeptide (TPR) repeat protein
VDTYTISLIAPKQFDSENHRKAFHFFRRGRGETPDLMEKTRLEFLQGTLAADPENTFVRYGLAMELKNAGKAAEAWAHFDYLLIHHPDYSAAYFQAAMLLMKLDRRPEARKVLEAGIEVTGRQGNVHAQSELRVALDDLESGN